MPLIPNPNRNQSGQQAYLCTELVNGKPCYLINGGKQPIMSAAPEGGAAKYFCIFHQPKEMQSNFSLNPAKVIDLNTMTEIKSETPKPSKEKKIHKEKHVKTVVKKDKVVFDLSLEEIADKDLVKNILSKLKESLDHVPCKDASDWKRVAALQEFVDSLGEKNVTNS